MSEQEEEGLVSMGVQGEEKEKEEKEGKFLESNRGVLRIDPLKLLRPDPGVVLEQGQSSDQNGVIRYQKGVTKQDLASTYVLGPLIRYAGMSYNFGTVVRDRSWTEVGQRSERSLSRKQSQSNEEKNKHSRRREYEIIRLSCIEGNTRLLYRRFGQQRPELSQDRNGKQ